MIQCLTLINVPTPKLWGSSSQSVALNKQHFHHMEIQILGLLLSLFESRTLGGVGWRVSTLYFNKSLGDSDAVQIREQLP